MDPGGKAETGKSKNRRAALIVLHSRRKSEGREAIERRKLEVLESRN